MRVTSINLCSGSDEVIIHMSFRDPGSTSPYIARNITGLDAEEIIPRFYYMSDYNKEKYFDLTIGSREIVIDILLNPTYGEYVKSYSQLRDDIYRSIAATRSSIMTLEFFDGQEELARISGFVTKVETEHFSEAPELKLTLRCDDPTLRAPERIKVAYLTETELPPGDPLEQNIYVSDSTAPHGFRFKATFMAAASYFYIRNVGSEVEWQFQINPLSAFEIGNIIEFSSESGNKNLTFYYSEGSVFTNIIDRIAPSSIWPILFPGDNSFLYSPEVRLDYIDYYPTYWGV